MYARGWSERTYAELAREAAHQLAERGGVIIDATFRRRADRAAFARTFAGAAPILLIECVAPGAVLAERAAARERDARRISDADLTVVLREQSSWEPLDEFPARSHIALRTDRPLAEIIADIESLLDARLPALIRSAG